MSNTRIISMQIKQIIKLYKQGCSHRSISEQLNMHRKTVKRYIKHFEASGVSLEDILSKDSDIYELLAIKPKKKPKGNKLKLLEEFLSHQVKNKSKPGFTIQNMYADYTKATSEQKYSRPQFYKHVSQTWNAPKGSVKLNHKYGQKMFVDYTGKKLSYVDKQTGELVSVEVLVVILPASQYIYVEAMESQKKEQLMNGIMNAMEFFGGVPLGIVTDNLKSAVNKPGKYQSVINESIQDMALHYGTVIDPTRTYKPKDKALVEGAVKIVYQSIFYNVQKHNHFKVSELNTTIREHLTELNNRKLTHSEFSRADQFKIEQEYLGELPIERYIIKQYRKAKVQKMGYVLCPCYKSYYSVPYRYIGKDVKLCYDQNTFEVFYKSERIAHHKTSQLKGQYVTITSHLSSNNKVCTEWNPQFFSDKAERHGISVKEYVDGLISQKSYPEQAYKQVLGILSLGKDYTSLRLDAACQLAMSRPTFSYSMIKSILENGKDQHQGTSDRDDQFEIPPHDNIRGPQQYE